jgi:hypothetical protein
MKISNTEAWILFSDNAFIKYFLWKENDIVKVVSEYLHPFIYEFDSIDEAIDYMNKLSLF